MTLRLGELTSLHWQRWGEEWVVFNEGSGQTILIDTLTAATLLILESGPSDRSDLEAQVAEELQILDRDTLSSLLERSLQSLKDLDWIETMVK